METTAGFIRVRFGLSIAEPVRLVGVAVGIAAATGEEAW